MEQRLDLDTIKKIELSLLVEINKVCEKENIRYSLVAGTLLGAIRHKGFIPWDDDIDIAMPRPDYERFIKHCIKNNTKFRLISHNNDDNYRNLFAKAYDNSTRIIDDSVNSGTTELGIYIDIFPIDGLGNSEKEAKKHFFSVEIEREILNASNWVKYRKSKTHRWYVEPIRIMFFLFSRICNTKKLLSRIEQRNKRYNFEDSLYVGCLCGSYRLKEIMCKEVFSNYIDVPFEGGFFKGLRDYNIYLTNIYGNYMELPPKNKRITHHTFTAFYKEE